MSLNTYAHPFDIATNLKQQEIGVYHGHTSDDYANMVGPFGGVIASTLLRAIIEHPDCLGSPVSFTVNYAAPVKDGSFIIKANPTRTNRSTQHWYVELCQHHEIVITAIAVTAKKRDTWSSTELNKPEVPDAERVDSLSLTEVPPWVNHYDIKIVKGAPRAYTKSNHADSVTLQWMKDKPNRPLDYLSLASMCDAFFPRIYVRREKVVPIGTVSLTVYFHSDTEALEKHNNHHVLGHTRAQNFNNGFYDQTGEIWSADGSLLATTTQLVYYKE